MSLMYLNSMPSVFKTLKKQQDQLRKHPQIKIQYSELRKHPNQDTIFHYDLNRVNRMTKEIHSKYYIQPAKAHPVDDAVKSLFYSSPWRLSTRQTH